MKKLSFLRNLIIFLLSCSCNKNDIYSDVVLKIGQLEITRYEFEKSKSRDLPDLVSSNNKVNTGKLQEWKKKYIEKYMMIADAYETGLDTITSIRKQVEYTTKLMVAQQYGYLWQKTISPVVDQFKQVTEEKIGKRKKLFYFDYIFCDDLQELLKINGNDTIFESVSEYNVLKSKCHLNKSFRTGYMSHQWPFLSFWEYKDYLFAMQEGEVSSLLTLDNSYAILFLDHIEIIEITDDDKKNLRTELQLGIEKEIDERKTREIELHCSPILNNESIELLYGFISDGNEIVDFNINGELMHYMMNDKSIMLDYATFLEYYNYLPYKPEILDKEEFKGLIIQYCYDDYLNIEAKKLGIYELDSFLLDQKMFKNGLLYGEYLQTNILNKIEIDSLEIISYYDGHTVDFLQPQIITADIYYFDRKVDAMRNMHVLSDLLKNNQPEEVKDVKVVENLSDVKKGYKIHTEHSSRFPNNFMAELLFTKTGELSTIPVEYEGKYVLLFKTGEEGQCIRRLDDVYDDIVIKIRQQKIEVRRQKRIEELKKKYMIEVDRTGIKG